jgi:hypothetical protein
MPQQLVCAILGAFGFAKFRSDRPRNRTCTTVSPVTFKDRPGFDSGAFWM